MFRLIVLTKEIILRANLFIFQSGAILCIKKEFKIKDINIYVNAINLYEKQRKLAHKSSTSSMFLCARVRTSSNRRQKTV